MLMNKGFKTVRSAIKFFAVSLSAAYLFSIGMKMTGLFSEVPKIPEQGMAATGISIVIGVAILIFGAAVRRFTAAETQAALLGAAAVLLASPLVQVVTTQTFDLSMLVVSGLGAITLGAGLLMSMARKPDVEE